MESLATKIERSPIVRILDSITKISVVVVIVIWGLEIDDRAQEREDKRRQKIYTAWQVMSLSEFFDNTAAKRFAVEDLISEKQPIDNVELNDENLSGGDYTNGSFKNVEFWDSNLVNAKLNKSTLDHAEFIGTDLRNVDFSGASMKGSIFANTDLSDTKGLTINQLSKALILPNVSLPKGINRELILPNMILVESWEADLSSYTNLWPKIEIGFSKIKSILERSSKKSMQPTDNSSAD
jgi:hypothetical protein